MKVYYIASDSFAKDEKDTHTKTVNYIQFKVGKKNLLTMDHSMMIDAEVDPTEIAKNVKKSEKLLMNSDVMIADITHSNGGIGFRIAQAMSEKKPILALRNKNEKKEIIHSSITSGIHKNIIYREYGDTDDITKFVDEFLEEAKQKIDTKFILIIPSEIDKYLNWASDFRRMHKAQVVRQAIEKEMSKDKDWKSYLRSDEF